MTDHYAEAERLVSAWNESASEISDDTADFAAEGVTAETITLLGQMLAAAQVHATLAAIPPYPKTAEDLRDAEAEIARLNAVIDGIRQPSDALVETVARLLCGYLFSDRDEPDALYDDLPEHHRDMFRTAARAVLAAIGGE